MNLEPRLARMPDGTLAAIAIGSTREGEVWVSSNAARTWQAPHAAGTGVSNDQDLISTSQGRLMAVALGSTGGTDSLTMNVTTSDDKGRTWTPSTGIADATTVGLPDRPWLAADPHDPQRVALVFDDLSPSSAGDYQVFVQMSHDGGRTFGPAAPILKPLSPVWWSVQCGEDGGVGGIAFSPTGDLTIAVPGRPNLVTGDGPAGACADLPPQQNQVFPTQVWALTAHRSMTAWTATLALDGSQGAGHVLCVQFCPPAYDDAGTLYIATLWTSTATQFDATLGYVYRKATDSAFHPMTTVSRPGQARLIPMITSGGAGRIAFNSLQTSSPTTVSSQWVGSVDVVTGADGQHPLVSRALVPSRTLGNGSSTDLAGAQQTSPQGASTVRGRSSDDFGITTSNIGAVIAIFADHTTGRTFTVTESAGPRLR